MYIPSYSSYYQGYLNKPDAWFITTVLKEVGHLCLDRTIDVETCLTEFFVSPDFEDQFLKVMNYFIAQGMVADLKKLPNRLQSTTEQV